MAKHILSKKFSSLASSFAALHKVKAIPDQSVQGGLTPLATAAHGGHLEVNDAAENIEVQTNQTNANVSDSSCDTAVEC
eukprot:5526908-Amphidinium_carterae.1